MSKSSQNNSGQSNSGLQKVVLFVLIAAAISFSFYLGRLTRPLIDRSQNKEHVAAFRFGDDKCGANGFIHHCFTEVYLIADKTEQEIFLDNDSRNAANLKVKLFVENKQSSPTSTPTQTSTSTPTPISTPTPTTPDYTEIASSDFLKPGDAIAKIILNKPLAMGDYRGKVRFETHNMSGGVYRCRRTSYQSCRISYRRPQY